MSVFSHLSAVWLAALSAAAGCFETGCFSHGEVCDSQDSFLVEDQGVDRD